MSRLTLQAIEDWKDHLDKYGELPDSVIDDLLNDATKLLKAKERLATLKTGTPTKGDNDGEWLLDCCHPGEFYLAEDVVTIFED